ncbi:MAG: ABC-F family ATP-binding cassette domain-containing protein [Candidatus Limivicinus sp.]|nr:ABC-F family ATP-binding cassette domain-containing protein [Candidatus Limivicinus sp.]
MIDISVSSLVKSFELGKNILDGLSFTVNSGERVGILGHNGCGKTTLFRILVGEIPCDEGEVAIAPSKRLGLISQIPVYPEGWTVEQVLKDAHRHIYEIARRMSALEAQMEHDQSPGLLRQYDMLQADYGRLGGYETDVDRSRVANGLDISPAMLAQPFASLSGGEKTRVNLARLILEDTDILLLDEPTNHLDLHATEWLEDYLLRFKGTVLAISHDRYFLDRIVQRSVEIVDGKAEFYSGNYSFYVEERQRRFEEKLKKYEKDQAKIEQLERAAAQMHLWAFMGSDKLHKRAFSMEKRIEKLSRSERPTEQKKLSARFRQREFEGDEVLVMDSISKSYGEKQLFSGLELMVTGGERIALIGDNGTGKSTLVKLIMNQEKPDSGYLFLGPAIRTAYLPQIVSFNDESRSALDTMLYDCRCLPQQARDRLAAFGFRGEDVMTPVGALSGGEKSRLRLCMLMGSDINFLILDEPTNHLDIASREWMEDALSDYEQTLLFVSHDRYFIDKFATRIWALADGQITDFRGSYQEYCDWRERQAVFAQNDKQREREKEKGKKSRPPRPKNNEKSIAKLEKEISKLEALTAGLDRQAAEFATDYHKLMDIQQQRDELDAQLLELYERWEELNA